MLDHLFFVYINSHGDYSRSHSFKNYLWASKTPLIFPAHFLSMESTHNQLLDYHLHLNVHNVPSLMLQIRLLIFSTKLCHSLLLDKWYLSLSMYSCQQAWSHSSSPFSLSLHLIYLKIMLVWKNNKNLTDFQHFIANTLSCPLPLLPELLLHNWSLCSHSCHLLPYHNLFSTQPKGAWWNISWKHKKSLTHSFPMVIHFTQFNTKSFQWSEGESLKMNSISLPL